MVIDKIKLRNYRNYDKLELSLNHKLNIIIGDNAQGKTNLLESIYVLSITKSYLHIADKNLIKLGNNFSVLEALVINSTSKKNLKLIISNKGKNVLINDKEVSKLSDYITNLKVIIFSPDNIRMIKDGPSVRRKFLNIEISQLSLKYIRSLMDYNKLINQKNEYLKLSGKKNYDYLSIMNDKICDLAIYIIKLRLEFINEINEYIDDIFFEITSSRGLCLKYISNILIDEDVNLMKNNFKNKLNSYLDKEINYKMSLIGPHRDDFIFSFNDKNLSLYGSQGQLRCAILALKLAEVKIFSKVSNDYPILLLDDIFSELDIGKKNNLIKYINDNVQTIITTTDINLIDNELVKKASIFTIKDGNLEKEVR